MQSIQKCGLEDCKVAKDIDIALLRSCRKDWWIEMKNVQISQELFAREIFSHRAGRNGAGDS